MQLTFKRAGAYLIDVLIGYVLTICVIQVPISLLTGFQDTLAEGSETLLWVWLTISPVVWSYFIIMEQRYQATIGKRLLNLKVVQPQTEMSPTTWQVIQRTFFKLLPWEINHFVLAMVWQSQSLNPAFQAGIVISYVLLFIYLGYTYAMKGRMAPYDLISRTQVQPAAASTG
jgi:uncharacterized RDD family membrane protein YckC